MFDYAFMYNPDGKVGYWVHEDNIDYSDIVIRRGISKKTAKQMLVFRKLLRDLHTRFEAKCNNTPYTPVRRASLLMYNRASKASYCVSDVNIVETNDIYIATSGFNARRCSLILSFQTAPTILLDNLVC